MRMIHPNTLLALILFGIVGCGGADTDKQALRDVFDHYFQAVQQRDGDTAASHVSQPTIDYYQSIIEMSLDYDEQQTKALPLTDKLMVVMTRHRIEPDVLRTLDGRGLFKHGVVHGWVGDDGMNKIAAGEYEFDFEIDGDEGWMSVKDPKSGASKSKLMRFVRESDAWKMDLLSVLDHAQPGIRKSILDAGMRENQFIELVAGFDSDKVVSPEVWQPIGR